MEKVEIKTLDIVCDQHFFICLRLYYDKTMHYLYRKELTNGVFVCVYVYACACVGRGDRTREDQVQTQEYLTFAHRLTRLIKVLMFTQMWRADKLNVFKLSANMTIVYSWFLNFSIPTARAIFGLEKLTFTRLFLHMLLWAVWTISNANRHTCTKSTVSG